jgi:hypothetical protein
MRIKTLLIASMALASGLAFAKPAKKGGPKGKKGPPPPPPAAAAPAAAPEPKAAAAPMESHDSGYKAAYGMAGCGLGAVVLKNDGYIQILGGTLNGLASNQLFAITSGTSNCKSGSDATASIEQRVFVEANLVSLNREAASGQGETLDAFADLLGCDVEVFNKVSKDNFGEIYQNSEPTAILSGYKSLLADQCSRII